MTKRLILPCALLALTFLGAADAARACTQRCVGVVGCKQCEDVGFYTGITCENNGPCGCFYVPNNCGGFFLTKVIGEAAPKTEVCAALPFTENVEPDPTAGLFEFRKEG